MAGLKIKVLGSRSRVGAGDYERRPGYVFTEDPSCVDYDWLVVYDELPGDDRGTCRGGEEPLRCPRERTILATWEPVSVKRYSRAYTRQFGHLLTNRPFEAERHPHPFLGRGYYRWFCGHTVEELSRSPKKDRLVSAVCSAKQMRRTKHRARFRLVSELAAEIPGFDWFGKGVRPLLNKYEALDPYRYHVVVENHIGAHHWTEKLADAFLCECLPFYAGDPAIGEVFPPESLIPIPIDDPAEALRIVRSAIESDEFSRRREAVLEAKRLVLTRYNFWDQVIELIESARGQRESPVDPARPQRIFARKRLRRLSPLVAAEDAWLHVKLVVGGLLGA